MVTELRWILLGLSVLLLVGIWWWGARRARMAPKNTEWRESTLGNMARDEASAGGAELHVREEESRDWGVPPFEPLQIAEMPMPALGPELGDAFEQHANESSIGEEPTIGELPEPPRDVAFTADVPESPVVAPAPAPTSSENQRIVTVRVSAVGEARWPGVAVMQALEDHGLHYGRYKVFHHKHTDGRTLFCAASLVEPGSFDIDKMPHEEFRGLTLFAVLPGPAEPLDTIDGLIATAEGLAETLAGVVQDSNGAPLSPQRAEALREDVARGQAR